MQILQKVKIPLWNPHEGVFSYDRFTRGWKFHLESALISNISTDCSREMPRCGDSTRLGSVTVMKPAIGEWRLLTYNCPPFVQVCSQFTVMSRGVTLDCVCILVCDSQFKTGRVSHFIFRTISVLSHTNLPHKLSECPMGSWTKIIKYSY